MGSDRTQNPAHMRMDRKVPIELIRHRPPSPMKAENLAILQYNEDLDAKLQILAQKESAVAELRERRNELNIALSVAEGELSCLKRDIALYRQRSNDDSAENSESMSKIAEEGLNAVTAIWHDVLSATIGQQATRKS